jgi:hypothetical protein
MRAEKLAYLLHGEPAIAIRGGNGVLQQRARGVTAFWHQVLDELIGNFDGDPHGCRLAEQAS